MPPTATDSRLAGLGRGTGRDVLGAIERQAYTHASRYKSIAERRREPGRRGGAIGGDCGGRGGRTERDTLKSEKEKETAR